MRRSIVPMVCFSFIGVGSGANPPAPNVPPDATSPSEDRPLWIEAYRPRLEEASRLAGDFEAVYSIELRKRYRVPQSAAVAGDLTVTRGKLTVRRRGPDVCVTYDFFDESNSGADVDGFLHSRQTLFFEGGKFVARLNPIN